MESLLDYLFVAGSVTHLDQQAALSRKALFAQAVSPLLVAYVAYFVLLFLHASFQSYTRRVVKLEVLKRRKAEGKARVSGSSSSMSFMRRHPDVVQHPAMIRADRGMQNQLEQFPIFIVSSLAYSLLVSVRWGGILTALYLSLIHI